MGGFFLSFSSQFEYDLSQVKVATRLLSISSPDLDSLLGTFLIPGNFLLIYLAYLLSLFASFFLMPPEQNPV